MRAHTGRAIATVILCVLAVATVGAQSRVPASTSVSVSSAERVRITSEVAIGADSHGASAQRPSPTGGALHAMSPELGPTTRGAAVGVRVNALAQSTQPILAGVQQRPRVGQSKALMIVGGAALVAGLIIGGDAGALLAVGGAVVGLYGLYQFVR